MFKYTSTTVVNTTLDSDGITSLFSGDENSFDFKRLNNFKAKNIFKVYHSPYVAPRKAQAVIDFNQYDKNPITDKTPVKGEHYRLSIYIRLDQSSQLSYYSNDMVFKGKPLSVEFVWQEDAKTTASYLANIIRKYEVAVYEKPIVKVSANKGVLTIDATDQYQRFHSVELEVYNAEAYHGMGEYIPVLKAVPAKVWDEETKEYVDVTKELNPDFVTGCVIKQGFEGFGTYEWLLHNLRLPTTARRRFMAQNSDETPIVGAHYDEFVIKYCVKRGIMGNNAVGDLVESMTTHVFYVNHNVLDSFMKAIMAPIEDEKDEKYQEVVAKYVTDVLEALPKEEIEHEDFDKEGRED